MSDKKGNYVTFQENLANKEKIMYFVLKTVAHLTHLWHCGAHETTFIDSMSIARAEVLR